MINTKFRILVFPLDSGGESKMYLMRCNREILTGNILFLNLSDINMGVHVIITL